MKKVSIIIMILFVLSVFLASCQTKPICNSPYILVGTSCCLDQNNNSICDNDEQINSPKLLDKTDSNLSNNCKNECDKNKCVDSSYFECINQDGCNKFIEKGKIAGKCGNQCLKNMDCEFGYKCESNICVKPEQNGSIELIDFYGNMYKDITYVGYNTLCDMDMLLLNITSQSDFLINPTLNVRLTDIPLSTINQPYTYENKNFDLNITLPKGNKVIIRQIPIKINNVKESSFDGDKASFEINLTLKDRENVLDEKSYKIKIIKYANETDKMGKPNMRFYGCGIYFLKQNYKDESYKLYGKRIELPLKINEITINNIGGERIESIEYELQANNNLIGIFLLKRNLTLFHTWGDYEDAYFFGNSSYVFNPKIIGKLYPTNEFTSLNKLIILDKDFNYDIYTINYTKKCYNKKETVNSESGSKITKEILFDCYATSFIPIREKE